MNSLTLVTAALLSGLPLSFPLVCPRLPFLPSAFAAPDIGDRSFCQC